MPRVRLLCKRFLIVPLLLLLIISSAGGAAYAAWIEASVAQESVKKVQEIAKSVLVEMERQQYPERPRGRWGSVSDLPNLPKVGEGVHICIGEARLLTLRNFRKSDTPP